MEAKIIYETQRKEFPAEGRLPAYQKFYQIAEVQNGQTRYILSSAKTYENENDRQRDSISGDVTTGMFVFVDKDRLINLADLLIEDETAGRKLLEEFRAEEICSEEFERREPMTKEEIDQRYGYMKEDFINAIKRSGEWKRKKEQDGGN